MTSTLHYRPGPRPIHGRSHRPVSTNRIPNYRIPNYRIPNYRFRRLVAAVVAVLLLVVVTVALVALLAGLGSSPASASAPATSSTGSPATVSATSVVHVAQPGDTLWSIAAQHRGTIAHDRYLGTLISLNGGTSIQAGQAVWLP